MIWEANGLEYGYPGAAENVVGEVHIAVGAGETVAILGPNGSGKTTLLKLLLGALAPVSGRVSFEGRPIREWDRAALARRVAVLPQSEEPAFPIRARELVETGRYPHLGRWRPLGRRDGEVVDRALERCGVADFAGREFATLSGGERQRVRLARALAQEPAALALDEPTASLDVAHEMEIWDLMADEARAGRAVLLTTHNLNLAARYADRLILLERGRVAASGRAAEVLTCATIGRVYDWPVTIAAHDGPGPDRNAPQVIPLRRPR